MAATLRPAAVARITRVDGLGLTYRRDLAVERASAIRSPRPFLYRRETPRDIACARADGVRVIAVATGPFGADALAAADAVVDSASAVVVVLEEFL